MKILCLILFLLIVSCSQDKTPSEPSSEEVKKTISEVEPKNEPRNNAQEPTAEEPFDAKFEKINGLVNYKRKSETVWEESQLETKLYFKDWIKTGEKSSTTVRIFADSYIELSEKSRIILLEKKYKKEVEQTIIGVKNGHIQGEVVGGNNKEVVLKLPNVWLKVRSSIKKGAKKIFQVSLSEDKVKVHTEKGEVQLVTKNKVVDLKEKQEFTQKIDVNTESEAIPDIYTSASPPDTEIKPADIKGIKPDKPVQTSTPKKVVDELKFFSITYPKEGQTFTQEKIKVRGTVLPKQKVLFRGQSVKKSKGRFSVDVSLTKGYNLLTFQVIEGSDVQYVSIGVERK